jgi:predicted nucleic acid-binding protein
MTLTDTGPIVALLDKDDTNHLICVAALKQLPVGPLLTTWCCFTEAMYLLGAVGGFRYQAELWKLKSAGRLKIMDLTDADSERMAELMTIYKDTPMDLADASLMAACERRALRSLFTLDSDFRIYRLADGSVLDLVP